MAKRKFLLLSTLLVFLSAADMIITEIGIRHYHLQELNLVIEHFRGISSNFAVYVKVIVPLAICVYLYYRFGLQKQSFIVFGRSFKLSSFTLLYIFNAYYLLAVIINTTGIAFVIFYLGRGI